MITLMDECICSHRKASVSAISKTLLALKLFKKAESTASTEIDVFCNSRLVHSLLSDISLGERTALSMAIGNPLCLPIYGHHSTKKDLAKVVEPSRQAVSFVGQSCA